MAYTNAKKIYGRVGAEAVLTEQSDLRQYLTGFESSFGYVLSDKNGSAFYTDPRYIEGATAALADTDIAVKIFEGSLEKLLKPYKQVAIPLSKTYYTEWKRLADAGLEIVDSEQAFIEEMSVKQPYELEAIEKACEITDKAFNALLSEIKEGMSENDLAAELEYLMRKYGASGTSFSTISAFGENSSVPHHETGLRKLKFGDIILLDFGCKFGGYCSDCTRTFLFGDDKKHEKFKTVYAEVLIAHELVKENLRAGMTGREADDIARSHLKKSDLAQYFTHSLGHGVGLQIHEYPLLTPRGEEVLKDGMVFSDEPGVYLKGEFGIRIEDTVRLEEGKAVSFMGETERNLIIL